MIRTIKLWKIKKLKGLKLDSKYKKALNYIISALNDWGYDMPKTLDIFHDEISKFLKVEKIYLDSIKQFIKNLSDDEILENAWEVEALSYIKDLFELFDYSLDLKEIFELVSNYLEEKTNIIVKDLEGFIVLKSKESILIGDTIREIENNTNQHIYNEYLNECKDSEDNNTILADFLSELVFYNTNYLEIMDQCIEFCKKIKEGNWEIKNQMVDESNFYFEASLNNGKNPDEFIKYISIEIK